MAKSFSKNKWNITKIEGDKIAYDMIYEVLFESSKDILEINELIDSLIRKTINIVIKYNNKKVNILNYLKTVHKGIIKFIDNYDMFGIIKKDNHIYIKLMEDYLEEWEIIDEDLSNI